MYTVIFDYIPLNANISWNEVIVTASNVGSSHILPGGWL